MVANPFLKAIDVLKERGWVPKAGQVGALCMVNALETVVGIDGVLDLREPFASGVEAVAGFRPDRFSEFFRWNDAPERTEEDVILALKHAAGAWDASHAEEWTDTSHGD